MIMVLHSVMPAQILSQTMSEENYQTLPRDIRPYANGFLEGGVVNGKFSVSRIISTDPAAYLDPAITLGTLL